MNIQCRSFPLLKVTCNYELRMRRCNIYVGEPAAQVLPVGDLGSLTSAASGIPSLAQPYYLNYMKGTNKGIRLESVCIFPATEVVLFFEGLKYAKTKITKIKTSTQAYESEHRAKEERRKSEGRTRAHRQEKRHFVMEY